MEGGNIVSQQCPPGTILYQIKAGDTLYRLAQRFGTTVAALISANPSVKPDQIQIGQRIYVPKKQQFAPTITPTETSTFTGSPGLTPYIVQPGDTFFKLAQRFSTTFEALIRANPTINPFSLLIGEQISIPETKLETTSTTSTSKETVPKELIPIKSSIPSKTEIGVLEVDIKPISDGPKVQEETDASIAKEINTETITTKEYRNPDYQVRFYYPENWQRIYDTRYEGSGGFFQVSVYAGQNLEQVCQKEAYHVLNPYGCQPTVRQFEVAHQPAYLILPSEDQPKEMANQAALIVSYQVPIQIRDQIFPFFVLWSNTYHIQPITDSLEFLSVKTR
jgi:LysM repeat protein